MHDAVRETLLARVYDVAVETPLELAPKLSAATGNKIYLKREDMQSVHSFKIRGAYNKMASLTPEQLSRGVLAASAGNHAQGVALSAQKLGTAATIVMPTTTPAIKIEAVESYGATVVLRGDNYSDAYAASQELMTQGGQVFIHPFDDPAVIAGQGTIGREILEQLPSADYIFVPVGGGGLLAGIAQYAKQLRPDVRIIGVEPADSNAMQASLDAGQPITLEHVGVFADGVAVKRVGDLTYDLCRRYVDEVITVTNDHMCAAIKDIFEATRSIVEPAGALSVAGAKQYAEQHQIRDASMVAILSGANLTFERLQFIAERTLLGSGREALFAVQLPESPGALAALCEHIISGHNITEFCYRMFSRDQAHILVGVSVASIADTDRFIRKLQAGGYTYQDLSGDDLAKEHIRHMIGGPSPAAQHEHLYEINFPERPRALAQFLATLGERYNISLFHYRGQGGDTGKVLIGIEAASRSRLESRLARTGYEYSAVSSPAAKTFL